MAVHLPYKKTNKLYFLEGTMTTDPVKTRKTKIKHNTLVMSVWTAAWVLSMALATFGPILIWHYDRTLSLLAIAVNLSLGAGMIWTNKRHIEFMDELERKIHLEAMAITLGVGMVVGLAYSTLEIANLIGQAQIAHLVIIQGMTYLGALGFGKMKYR